MTKTNEAFWWSLFSAGGVMAALFIPAFILVTGFILPFVSADDPATQYEHIHPIVFFWLTRMALFAILALCFFHCAHRIRHVLHDLGVHADGLLMVLCYGAALVATAATMYVLLISRSGTP